LQQTRQRRRRIIAWEEVEGFLARLAWKTGRSRNARGPSEPIKDERAKDGLRVLVEQRLPGVDRTVIGFESKVDEIEGTGEGLAWRVGNSMSTAPVCGR
jgi:hypothetical protein